MEKIPLPEIGYVLPGFGFVRLAQIVGKGKPIPVSTSTWWDWVKSGKAPQPIKLSANVTAWRAQDIRAFIAEFSEQEQAA